MKHKINSSVTYKFLHQNPLPLINSHEKKSITRSNSYLSKVYKENIQINPKDFCSERVKAQIFRIEKNQMLKRNIIARTRAFQNCKLKFPLLPEKFKRFNLIHTKEKITKDTIDKILDKCEIVRKNARKLSYEISCSGEDIKNQFKSFQKRLTS